MKQDINLYQPAVRNGSFPTAATLVFSWLALVAVLAASQFWLQATIGSTESDAHDLQQQLATTLDAMNQQDAARLAGSDSKLETQLAAALKELDLRESILALVSGNSAGDVKGFSSQLRSLARQDSDEIWLTHVRVTGPSGHTSMAGHALRPEAVPIYLLQLAAEPSLAGQRFDIFEIQRPEQDGQAVSFSLNRTEKIAGGVK